MDFAQFEKEISDLDGLRQEIRDREARLHDEAVENIQNLIDQLKIKSTELRFADQPSTKKGGVIRPVNPVAPKYRNPESGETWSGRGRTPVWMTQAIEQGSKKEDFLI
ncbi:H-NS family nucleoid-associated regulatory protein [Sutterella seckii]|uniref:H-NS histone family protein n=1 Tax=Sutterella seckii TaxID=1944635 RepID=A0AAI9SAT0_9BURK|nr:H-NS histone family protein [Sutterella seckii]KAB7649399.1 H-NS histone family protein [Sutterella seckii]